MGTRLGRLRAAMDTAWSYLSHHFLLQSLPGFDVQRLQLEAAGLRKEGRTSPPSHPPTEDKCLLWRVPSSWGDLWCCTHSGAVHTVVLYTQWCCTHSGVHYRRPKAKTLVANMIYITYILVSLLSRSFHALSAPSHGETCKPFPADTHHAAFVSSSLHAYLGATGSSMCGSSSVRPPLVTEGPLEKPERLCCYTGTFPVSKHRRGV